MKFVLLLWNNRTKVLGFMQVTLGVIAGSTGIIPANVLPVLVLLNGLMTAWVGFFNSAQLNKEPPA